MVACVVHPTYMPLKSTYKIEIQPKILAEKYSGQKKFRPKLIHNTDCRREGFNVLALGQHLDDLAESFLMSAFHNGRLRTMKANYSVAEGDLRVVRPFAYVREKQAGISKTEIFDSICIDS
jgi:hypothetical protein